MYTLVLCSAIAIRSMCHGQPKCAATTVRSGCAAATGSSLRRVRQIDPDALAAGLAGADPAGAGVEQGQQAVPLAGREDRPVLRVVGREGLQRRVELHPAQAERGDLGHLGHGLLALMRVHRAQAHEHVGVVAARGGHGLVRHPRPAGRRLRRPRPAGPP